MSETKTARKGDLVQVHFVVLEAEERGATLPEPTRRVPYEGWVKGFLLNDAAEIGQLVQIETLAGRTLTGALSAINPPYTHNFGSPQPELNTAGSQAWARLKEK